VQIDTDPAHLRQGRAPFTEQRGPEPLTDRCLSHMPRQPLHPLEVVAGSDGRDDRAQAARRAARDGRVEQQYLRGGRIGR
jgi:hypothetical protein